MRKTLYFFLFIFFISSHAFAQKDVPKWAEKVKKAIFTIVTYDNENNILNTGKGFFLTEDGIACSDYSLFVGAEKATIITSEEKQFPIKAIVGVNEMYDLIKFEVGIDKKVTSLLPGKVKGSQDEKVYLMTYSPQKERNILENKIIEVAPISGGYSYYTLSGPYNEKWASCPLLNENGEVLGIIQTNPSDDTEAYYAIDATFADNLSFNALSVSDRALSNIGIRKALPSSEDQALVYLLIRAGGMSNDEYLSLLDEFIEKFPTSTEGYIRRATHYINNFKDATYYNKAEEDLKKAENVSKEKDNVYYNIARLNYFHALDESEFNYKNWGLDRALQENTKALAINNLPLYLQQQGDIYFAMQAYDKAAEYYDQVNQTNLVSPSTYYNAAKAKQLMEEDLKEVIALLDSAISLFPVKTSAEASPYILERAQLKVENNMYREAVEDYDLYYEAVRGQVNDLFFYYREQANYRANNFTRALEDINKALEISPEDPIYWAELGAVNIRFSHYEEAIKSLQTALKYDPEFSACYRLIGFCQIQLEQNEAACENFTKAKELGDEAVINMISRYCQ